LRNGQRNSGSGTGFSKIAGAFVLGAAVAGAPVSRAQDDFLWERKHNLSAGVAFTAAEPRVTAIGENGRGGEADFKRLGANEDDLNYFLEYRWRFRPKWALVLASSRYDATGSSRVDETFDFDGITVEAGAETRAGLSIDVYLADILYQVRRTEHSELMIGGGVHALDLGAALQVRVFANDLEQTFEQTRATLLAPVPNLRASYVYARDRWGLSMIGGWLSANVDDFRGDFFYGHLRGHYRFADSWYASLGYQYTDVDVERRRPLSTTAFDLIVSGPTLTFSYAF